MKKISVLIPDGENEHVLWVVRSLAESRQVNIHVLSTKPWMPVRFSRYCRYDYCPGQDDDQARLEAIRAIARRSPVDVILPVSEDAVLFAATERDQLAKIAALPPLPDLEALRVARNKWLLNQFACEHDIQVPEAVLVTLDPIFYQRIETLEYPVLLKPITSTDGQGIRRFNSSSELRQLLTSQDQSLFQDKCLVQSFVPGFDMGFSVLYRDGEMLAHTIQQGIISASHRFGPLMAMEFIRQHEVLASGQKLLSALRWSGIAHVDFRFDRRDSKPKILEVNARYWGSLLGSLVAGVNFPYLACQAALGMPFSPPEYHLKKYAHLTTAIKESVLALIGKNTFKNFSYQETGLRFFGPDPLPEIVKRVQGLN
jgi:predicted ATP-grasp superfamily ATP-dependent carboligase